MLYAYATIFFRNSLELVTLSPQTLPWRKFIPVVRLSYPRTTQNAESATEILVEIVDILTNHGDDPGLVRLAVGDPLLRVDGKSDQKNAEENIPLMERGKMVNDMIAQGAHLAEASVLEAESEEIAPLMKHIVSERHLESKTMVSRDSPKIIGSVIINKVVDMLEPRILVDSVTLVGAVDPPFLTRDAGVGTR